MHYHYFTLEQRSALEGLIAALPDEKRTPALARLHSAQYGVCATCGGDIPFARLLADPLLERCPACA